ncbi:MAG TPA: chromosome partitioning protein ParB, partial [Verrucomicrobiae bacterium]|nr:chromosome partitioning protein ParB [Verrucomicrobiae bacterium]
QTEELVAQLQGGKPGAKTRARGKAGAKDVHVADLERRLQERLGTKVALRYREGKGALEIHFYTDADLERVLEVMGVRPD